MDTKKVILVTLTIILFLQTVPNGIFGINQTISADAASGGVIYQNIDFDYVSADSLSYLEFNIDVTAIYDYPEIIIRLQNLGDSSTSRTFNVFVDGVLVDTSNTNSAIDTAGDVISLHPEVSETKAYKIRIDIIGVSGNWKLVSLLEETIDAIPIMFKMVQFDRFNELHLSLDFLEIFDYPDAYLYLDSLPGLGSQTLSIYIDGTLIGTDNTDDFKGKFGLVSFHHPTLTTEDIHTITLKISGTTGTAGAWQLVSLKPDNFNTFYGHGLGAWQGFEPVPYQGVDFPVLIIKNPAPYPSQNVGSSSSTTFTNEQSYETEIQIGIETQLSYEYKVGWSIFAQQKFKIEASLSLGVKITDSVSITETSLYSGSINYFVRGDVLVQPYEFLGYTGDLAGLAAAAFDVSLDGSGLYSTIGEPTVTPGDISTYPTLDELKTQDNIQADDVIMELGSGMISGETRTIQYEQAASTGGYIGSSLSAEFDLSGLGHDLSASVKVSFSKETTVMNKKAISTTIIMGTAAETGDVDLMEIETILYSNSEGTPVLDFAVTTFTSIGAQPIDLTSWTGETLPTGKFKDFYTITTPYGDGWHIDTVGSNHYSYTFFGKSQQLTVGASGDVQINGMFRLYDTFWSSLQSGRRYLRIYILNSAGSSILSSHTIINYNEGTGWLYKSLSLNLTPGQNIRIGVGRGDAWYSDWQLTAEWADVQFITS